MQGYQVLEESILYRAGSYRCELQFIRCSEPHKVHPIYDLELIVDGATTYELYDQAVGEAEGTFTIFGLKHIIPATTAALDDWCYRHPYTFISFFDGLSNLFSLYFKLGFDCNGRGDTFIAYVDETGKRTTFPGMLNFLAEDDFWVNDIWRLTKTDYYIGNIETPVDFLNKIFTEMGLAIDRPAPVVVKGDYSQFMTAVLNRLSTGGKLLVEFAAPLGGKGQLRRLGSRKQQRVFVIRQGTLIAHIHREQIRVMGLVHQEEDVRYDLSAQTVANIVAAIDNIDVSTCKLVISQRRSSLPQQE